MIDINDLKNKTNNAEQTDASASIPANEKLTASEFVEKVVKPIIELQDSSVRKIVRGSTTYTPVDGVVTFPSEGASVGIVSQESTSSFIETGDKVLLHLRITSIEGGADTGSLMTVDIQRFANGSYTTMKTVTIPSRKMTDTGYDEFDITDCITDGDNQIRIQATDTETLAYGRLVFASVVKASLSVEPMFSWETAITNIVNGIPLSYAISGTGVDKTLHIRITDNQQKLYRDLTYVIGKSTYPVTQPWSPSDNPKDISTDTVKIMSHGVHTVEAWVTCQVGDTTSASPHIKNQIMVVADAASTKSYLMIQQTTGIKEGETGSPYLIAENYVQTDNFFAYAVYNPANPLEGTKVAFSIDNASSQVNCLKTENQAKNGTKYYVPATIQLEDATVGVDSFVYLSATDANGNNFLSSKDSARLIVIVRNQYNFAPTKGADLYINPSNRNNGEANPARILNAAKDNAVIPATFTNFRFDGNDGWLQNANGQRVLRILAGQKVAINYDPFSDFKNNYSSNVTIEFDMLVKNVANENDPIINISNDVVASGKYVGVRMAPLEGCIMTSSQTTYGQQNFGWREDTKTHIAINICSAIYADTGSRNTIPLVRVFVNANPYREFMFALEKDEWGNQTYRIEIGQADAEIDIYSMRVYKKAVSAQDIMQNYKSSLPTTAEKLAFESANDILASDGTISYEKAREKYSCIVHHGKPTSLQNPENTTCWLHIDHFVNGVYDKATSGDICKATKYLPVKGQGSTAKHYADWNQQYDVKKSVVPASDTTTPYISKTGDDGTVTKLPAITVNGELKQDGWVDGNGVYKGVYYQLSTSDNKAEKLVGKINYASSMQSHKMGAIAAYNDLYRSVMGDSLDTIMAADLKARCTCKEDMFFFFVQETDADTPRFEGIMTFGSGKMDKKTWGYDSSKYPDFGMFEGSDNDQPVTNFERPWDNETTYNPDEEYYEYNGKGNIDFDAGATTKDTEGKEIPTGTAVNVIKSFINFGYLHCTDLAPWSQDGGTATSLISAGNTIDIHKQYWITVADSKAARGDLYSWSPLNSAWVPAGINKATRNVFTENPTVTFSADYVACNNALIESIITRFKANGSQYYNVRSKLFHSCFVENLIAGSDNCAKNTYYVADPTKHIICFHADDLDTIFKTDNVGWQTKPYYVDRVHHVDDNGKEAYSGTHNMFFNTFDRAYESEKQTMMKDIFTAMASLGGSVNGFMDKYFFNIQRTIPCVAYLEQARIRYEKRQIQVNNSEITLDTVNPITQQLGSQLESELQYMDRRLAYFMSYAAYGQFGVGGGGNSFGFRGYPKRNGQGAKISFTLKPHQYIYPTAAFGQTLINPHVRLSPADTYEIILEESCASDTTCSLFGIDYYKEIGNLGSLSVNPEYAISIGGKRLAKVEAYPTDGGDGEFRPSQIAITATLVDSVKINVKDVGNNLDLSSLTRLKTVDVKNTSLNRVTLPSTQTLTSVQFGEKISSLNIINAPNLETLTLQGYAYLAEIVIGSTPKLNTSYLATQAYLNNAPVTTLSMTGVYWGVKGSETEGISALVMQWMYNRASVTLTGYINIVGGVTSAIKKKLLSTFGAVDSESNPLYITYPMRAMSGVSINGFVRIRHAGSYPYTAILAPDTANNFVSIKWSITANEYATINEDTGVLTATSVPTESIATPTADVKATVTKTDGTTDTATMKVYLYNRVPKVGDFAYSDGEFDETLHTVKTVVGWVYRVDKISDEQYKCHIQAASYISFKSTDGGTTFGSLPWGIYAGNTYTPQTVIDAIASALGITSDQVRDLATIPNIGSTGLYNNSHSAQTDSYVKDYNAYNDSNAEGFETMVAASADWDGKQKTSAIIAHANNVLGNYALNNIKVGDKTLISYLGWTDSKPKTLQELADLLVALKNANTSADLCELAYPAAYSCYLYEPNVESLDEQYKKGCWYLPAGGDLVRQYIFFRNSRGLSPQDSGTPTKDYADIDNANRETERIAARRPWYANLLKRSDIAGASCPINLPSQSYHWSSMEYYSDVAWNVYFYNGLVGSNGKYNSYVVRPSVAYIFNL